MNWFVRKLDYKIDKNDLHLLYSSLLNDYNNEMFIVGKHAKKLKQEYGKTSMYGWTFEDAYGWALQSWKDDTQEPLPFINCGPSQYSDMTATDMFKLLPKNILEKFPTAWEYMISCHPKDTYIKPHTDNGNYFKIHVPIHTSEKFFWLYGDKDYEYSMSEEGRCYLMNTQKRHGTINRNNCTRVHLIFKVPYQDALKFEYVEQI